MHSFLQRPLRVAAALAVAATLLTAASASNASTIYDNLGASQDGSDPLFSFGPLADSFTTGAAGNLSGVTVLLGSDSSSIVGDIQVGLYASTGGAPGAEVLSLGSLSSAAVSTSGFNAYEFSAASSFKLAANTTYWVEIVSSSPNALEWSWSNDLSAPGVAGESSYSAALGTSANSDFGPYQMAVEVSAVPEPASIWLALLGMAATAVAVRRRAAAR
jgi:hypothetical protein